MHWKLKNSDFCPSSKLIRPSRRVSNLVYRGTHPGSSFRPAGRRSSAGVGGWRGEIGALCLQAARWSLASVIGGKALTRANEKRPGWLAALQGWTPSRVTSAPTSLAVFIFALAEWRVVEIIGCDSFRVSPFLFSAY